MKCIHCDYDSKYKERKDSGRCPGCSKPFAFEPRAGAPITDLGFKRALDTVSADGHVKWGVEHLYYEVCRRVARARRTRPAVVWTVVVISAFVTLAAAVNGMWIAVVLCAAPGIAVPAWAFFRYRRTVPLSQAAFEGLWARWQKVHQDHPRGVIVRRNEPARPARRPAEADIPLYSFDRAVICDRARTVDLLLANNFHFENNCAVLSIDGYPPGPFATVRAMLKRNPRLHVFALHDATAAGCRLAHRLADDAEWFKGQARVVDVGLRPAHARAFPGLLLPAHGAPLHEGSGITGKEAAWLSQYSLELAAIRPEQALKRLYRAINEPRRKRRDDGDGGGDGSGGSTSGDGRSGEGTPALADADGQFGGAGASGELESSVLVDTDAFSGDAGDMDGDGDGDG